MPMLRIINPTTVEPTKKKIVPVVKSSRTGPYADLATLPKDVEPHRRAHDTSRYREKSVMAAETIMRRVKGMMPARAHESGMERTPPPIMVAVMLNVAAIRLAFRRFEPADGTTKATEAMDVA
mmetsp:Transcript_24791/g.42451  ORF Transcript_24791/g.42451 Transcript_24791/m.42451 type:complete len:123 (-) Transcript_24791:292-660(-)